MAKVRTKIDQKEFKELCEFLREEPGDLHSFKFFMAKVVKGESLAIGGEMHYNSSSYEDAAYALKAFLKEDVEMNVMEPIESEWVHPEAEAIFNALLGAYPHAQNAGWKAQFWRSAMLSLGELYPADKHIINAFFLSEMGISQDEPQEIPAKQAKQPSEYRKEPDYSAKAGRETSGKCESCG